MLDDQPEKIEQFALRTSAWFNVQVQKDLCLLTIRHYNEDLLKKLSENKVVLLQQRTPETVQALMH